ncbi:hypothetical protein [Streptomyces sp. TRM68416]|uniref:hypothetical protein n=1 Tax=Streptomyces sp. TRM68416 TaxID=2758412 RepID=UPI001661BC6D|nr:hypothetical protein [Streptomyces sp. TRM68416]MBD0843739.1 hypothetical protein [Streptomyces sp. TRM68416]
MITARSLRRVARTRLDAGSLPRVLALAVLLFGVLLTHGMQGESAGGHFSVHDGVHQAAVASVLPQSAVAAADHGGGHDPARHGEHCASGQPQQGPVLVSPCFAASVRESTGTDDTLPPYVSAAGAASPVALRAASVVRQV